MNFLKTATAIFLSVSFSILSCASCVFCQAQSAASAETVVSKTLSIQLNEEGIAAIKADKFDQAEALFEKALKADTGNITAAFNLSGVLLNNKRTDEAISILKRYIKLFPEDAGLYVRLADCYFSQKQIDLAIPEYEKAIVIDPKYPRLSSKLGTVYGLKGRMKDAEKMYRNAVKDNHEDLQSLENLCALLVANGKAEEAVPLIKTVIARDNSRQHYELLGQAYQILGDKENAEIAFGRAKSLKLSSQTPISQH